MDTTGCNSQSRTREDTQTKGRWKAQIIAMFDRATRILTCLLCSNLFSILNSPDSHSI